jgi:hypothetical protein
VDRRVDRHTYRRIDLDGTGMNRLTEADAARRWTAARTEARRRVWDDGWTHGWQDGWTAAWTIPPIDARSDELVAAWIDSVTARRPTGKSDAWIRSWIAVWMSEQTDEPTRTEQEC